MLAIITAYHEPTDTDGERYSASDCDGNRVFINVDPTLTSTINCDAAVLALHHKMNWPPCKYVRGYLGDYMVYVVFNERDVLEAR